MTTFLSGLPLVFVRRRPEWRDAARSRKHTRSGWRTALARASMTAVCGCWISGQAAESITTSRLLDDMIDLKNLSRFPEPAFTCRQFSSYDRKSKSPSEDWFANGDAGQYLRVEERGGRKEHVMMDIAGPGAITRIWSANPAGTIRIYLDGSDQPALAAPMTDLLGGSFPGLPRPIAGEYSKGWNLYFPIPYARHCKVTSDQGGFYYHVNYRTYPGGTTVETFRLDHIKALGGKIEKVASRLNHPRLAVSEFDGSSQPFDLVIPAGESVTQELDGPAAISRAVLRIDAAQREAVLRGLVLKVAFDGEDCIEAPLGDFFGSAPGINPFSTLPTGMAAPNELYCQWTMPFRNRATIELVNHTAVSASLSGELMLSSYTWDERSMHFHAKWRSAIGVPTRPMVDWNYLTARGCGVFAGVSFSIDNPVRDWWGEGDEKIYVDGEAFPSHFGTGTEDYYGYAWCWPGLFTHAYHSQSRCDGPGNYGRTSINRFHVVDSIPFTRDFRFDMELWHWKECRVNMAVVSYWYARPGATDTFPPIRAEAAVVQPMPEYVVPRVAGALEGEKMRVLQVAGKAEPQDWADISGGQHLWWHAGMKPGDVLTLEFPVVKSGQYEVIARFLSARDYGIHQLAINGQNAGAPRDFYQPDVKITDEISLGTFDLKEGGNRLSVTVVGANAKAVQAYMFGLDYVRLKPAP